MQRLLRLLHLGFALIAGVALVAMLFVTVADIVLRGVGTPLAGAYEVIGWFAAISVAGALGYTQAHKGHVAIDLLIVRLPERVRRAIDALMLLAAAALFAVAAWHLALYAYDLHLTGSMSQTLRAPVYPWVYLTAAGVGVLALVLVHDFLEALAALLRAPRASAPPARELP